MGLFDLFRKSGNESSLKRNNTSQNSFLQDLLHGSNNPCAGAIEITFDYHQRYENGNPVLGEQNHKRTLKIEKNVLGDIGYTVSINPSMSPKRMKVISCSNDKIKLQGYGYDNNAVMMGVPKEAASFECYALTLNVASSGVLDRAIISCDLHLLDRNIDLKYYRHSKKEEDSFITNGVIGNKDGFDSHNVEPSIKFNSPLKFSATRYEEWENGAMVSKGVVNLQILTKFDSDSNKFYVNIQNNNISNKIQESFEFDNCCSLPDRLLMFILPQQTNIRMSIFMTLPWTHQYTRKLKVFNPTEPGCGSIFTKNGIINKMSFTFHNDRLIEFY